MSTTRNKTIDLFRGLIISDMIIMHFVGNFPRPIVTAIELFDFAIEGFILLAGFMIGGHYLPKFRKDKLGVSKRLAMRAIKIAAIQYLLILTVSLPFYAFTQFTAIDKFIAFATTSFLFLNQIPIIHILPTFIPLLAASPLILLLLASNHDWWLVATSVGLFLLGLQNPYVFTIGQKTIFPVVLWQVYFVAGCIIGKKSAGGARVDSDRLLLCASLLFCASLFMKYGGYFDVVSSIKAKYDIYPKKFPLNLYGLAYGASLLLFVYVVSLNLWERLTRGRQVLIALQLLGRHSLAVFVGHVYMVYGIRALVTAGANVLVVCGATALSLVAIYFATLRVDRQCRAGTLPGAYRWLFA